MTKIERELSLSVLELIEEILPSTRLAKNQKLKSVLQRYREVLQDDRSE